MTESRTEFPTLYKMDSKGKIRMWRIVAGEDNGMCWYAQEHGLLDGKKQATSTDVKEGKNIGKSNETTVWEQCQLEAESLWTKQRDRKGYSETIPTEKPHLPMLAQSYDKYAKKIVWPALCQPKLDGIRCNVYIKDGAVTSLRSRTNKEFTSIDHVATGVETALQGKKFTGILDGELYNHQFKDDFQRLISAVKRDKPTDHTNLIQYHVYDLFGNDNFKDRSDFIFDTFVPNDTIELVSTHEVADFDEFLNHYKGFINQGYEGGMLRNFEGPYQENKRSYNLQKYKAFNDEEFVIVGTKEGKGKFAGMCIFRCVTSQGAQFDVMPKGTEEQRRQYWQDRKKHIGKQLTVRYFEWTTSDPPVPRFPVGIAIREDYE